MTTKQHKNCPNDNFSARLRSLMDEKGCTQAVLAAQTGISPSALVRYKTDRIPKSEELHKLASFFGVSMEWLLTGQEGNPQWEGVLTMEAGERVADEMKQEKAVKETAALLQKAQEELEMWKGLAQEKSKSRQIPLLGWAHAGDALDYEENHERQMVPTECRDPKAFAVKLEGDSMEPRFHEDDVLVVMPSEFAHSGCFAVCKFKDGGVIFRSIDRQQGFISEDGEKNGEAIVRLIPMNVRWTVTDHKEKDFEWIYPVWGRWTQIWK